MRCLNRATIEKDPPCPETLLMEREIVHRAHSLRIGTAGNFQARVAALGT